MHCWSADTVQLQTARSKSRSARASRSSQAVYTSSLSCSSALRCLLFYFFASFPCSRLKNTIKRKLRVRPEGASNCSRKRPEGKYCMVFGMVMFKRKKTQVMASCPYYARDWERKGSGETIRVMQFNMLADCLAQGSTSLMFNQARSPKSCIANQITHNFARCRRLGTTLRDFRRLAMASRAWPSIQDTTLLHTLSGQSRRFLSCSFTGNN